MNNSHLNIRNSYFWKLIVFHLCIFSERLMYYSNIIWFWIWIQLNTGKFVKQNSIWISVWTCAWLLNSIFQLDYRTNFGFVERRFFYLYYLLDLIASVLLTPYSSKVILPPSISVLSVSFSVRMGKPVSFLMRLVHLFGAIPRGLGWGKSCLYNWHTNVNLLAPCSSGQNISISCLLLHQL